MKEFTDTELANEQWRDVDGYDGAYQVSDLGRVRSKKYGYWRVMKGVKSRVGYLLVGLWKDGKKKRFLVHRLVAQAFIQNDDETKIYVNHRNEIKSDNRVSNIEYCTVSYNNTYNDLRRRCVQNNPNYKRENLKDIYRTDLTYQQNIDMFKEQGIECSTATLYRIRKEFGLTRKHKPYKSRKEKQIE